MNISVVEQREGYAKIQVDVTQEDYQEKFQQELKQVAKNVKMDGFRPGKAPLGMVKKLYGEGVRYEVINREIGHLTGDFIEEKEFQLIGAPMPVDGNEEEIKKDEFTLYFELALKPTEFDFDFGGKSFTKYEVSVSDEQVNEELERVQKANAQMQETDNVQEEAIVGGDIAELEGDVCKEGGILRENVTIYPRFIKDEEEKAKFLEAGKGSVVIFNPYKAFDGNESELTSLFGIEKDEVSDLKDKEFSFQIETVRHMVPAELNQEFFDAYFGADQVHNEEEAKAKLREFIEKGQESNADYEFSKEFLGYLKDEKATNLELADDLIVEWYIQSRKQADEDVQEDVDKERLIKSLKDELYIRELAKREEVEVSHEELQGFAYETARQQFAQMGWYNPDHEILTQFADRYLQDSNTVYSMEVHMLEQKLSKAMQDKVSLENKKVTSEEFEKLIQPEPEEEQPEA